MIIIKNNYNMKKRGDAVENDDSSLLQSNPKKVKFSPFDVDFDKSDHAASSSSTRRPPSFGAAEKMEDEDSDLEFDTFSGRKARQGAVKDIIVDEEEAAEDNEYYVAKKEKQKGKKSSFEHSREYEEARTTDSQNVAAFNLDDEMEEGHFDESGNYIRNRDENRDKDNWLQGVSEKDIEKAKEAKRIQLERESAAALANSDTSKLNLTSLYRQLLQYLEPGQTPTIAMKSARAKMISDPKKIKGVPKRKKKVIKSDGKGETLVPLSTDEKSEIRKEIEAMTDLCSHILERGVIGIYDMTFEEIYKNISK